MLMCAVSYTLLSKATCSLPLGDKQQVASKGNTEPQGKLPYMILRIVI